jgi:type II secretory pathway pseudopilin PulG
MRPPRADRGQERDRGRDRGQAALEFAGLITLLLVAALAAIQLGIAAFAVQQAGTAARAAARTASYEDGDYQTAGSAALSGGLTGSFQQSGSDEEVTITATVPVPAILPLFDFGNAVRSATMPRD